MLKERLHVLLIILTTSLLCCVFYLTFALSVTRCAGHSTDLPWNSNFLKTVTVKKMLTEKVRKQKTQILVIKRTQSGESKLIFSDDLKLRKHELNSKGFFNWCSSLTVKFAKFVVFMIISVVALKVFYCNTLWNLKEYKCFHRRVKIRHNFHVEAIHYFEW